MLSSIQNGSAFELAPGKEGFQASFAVPARSSDSGVSTETGLPQVQPEAHSMAWHEGDWVFDTINMVAEQVPPTAPAPMSPITSSVETKASNGTPVTSRKTVKAKRRGSATGVRPLPAGDVEGVETSAGSATQRVVPGICQVDTCKTDLSKMRKYNLRYKVCETCLKSGSVPVNGKNVRFCQQCSCFHEVSAFDGTKRSCREQLERHNKRRRERIEAATAKALGAGINAQALQDMLSNPNSKRSRVQPMDSASSEGFRNMAGGSFTTITSATASRQPSLPNPPTEAPMPMLQEPSCFTAEEFELAVQESTKSLGNSQKPASQPMPEPVPSSNTGMFAAPSAADVGILRQLAPNDAMYIMPNSNAPLVLGSHYTQPETSNGSVNSRPPELTMTGAPPPLARHDTIGTISAVLDSIEAGHAGHDGAAATAEHPSAQMGKLDSFKKWASMALAEAPLDSPNPLLSHMDSFKKWASGALDENIPTLEQLDSFKKIAGEEVAATPGLHHMDSFKKWAASMTGNTQELESPAKTSVGGPHLANSLSLDMMWSSIKFEASGETFPPVGDGSQPFFAPEEAAAAAAASDGGALSAQSSLEHPAPAPPQGPAPPVLSGSVLSLPENLLQDALEMLEEPTSTAYGYGDEQVVRLSIKMFNRSPSDLTPDMRHQLEHVQASASVNDSYLQQGCTHLVVDMAVPAGSCTPSQLAKALSSGPLAGQLPAGHFLAGQGILQGPGGMALRLEDGRIVAGVASSAAPIILGADSSVLYCGSESVEAVLTIFAIHNLSTGDVSKLSVAVRQGGAYLPASTSDVALLGPAVSHGTCGGLVRIRLSLPVDSLAEGLLYVELSNGGVLSAPLPVVATADGLVRKELAQLGPARPLPVSRAMSPKDTDALLVTDIGLLLDAVASKGTARDVVARASSTEAEKAAQASRQARRARSVLLAAAEHGWVGVASAALDQAADDCDGSAKEAVERTSGLRGPGGAGLLHAAVRGRNPVLLSMLLEWAGGKGTRLDVLESRGGAPSPLHLSSALDDGGVMAELLLQHAAPGNSKAQYAMWADPNGRALSPEAVAERCGRQGTVSRMAMKRPLEEGESEGQPSSSSAPAAAALSPQMSMERPTSAPVRRRTGLAKAIPGDDGSGGLLAKARKLWSATQRRLKGKDKEEAQPGEFEKQLPKLDSAKDYMDPSNAMRMDSAQAYDGDVHAGTSRTSSPTIMEEEEPMGADRGESFLAPLPPQLHNKPGILMPRTDSARDEEPQPGKGTVQLATPHNPMPAKAGAEPASSPTQVAEQLARQQITSSQ